MYQNLEMMNSELKISNFELKIGKSQKDRYHISLLILNEFKSIINLYCS